MKGPDATIRLTVGQAVVRFLVAQHTERDGTTQRAILGISGIVGHGNVLGLAQGVEEDGHEVSVVVVPTDPDRALLPSGSFWDLGVPMESREPEVAKLAADHVERSALQRPYV